MKIISFTSIVLIITLTGCSSRGGSKTSGSQVLPYQIEIEKNFSSKKSIPLSSIGGKLEYIVLETKTDNLLARVAKVLFTDSYIFISDGEKLVQFDKTGKYLRNIGSQGRGPEQYLNMCDFEVDESSSRIYLLDDLGLFVYDFEGKFIESKRLQFTSLYLIRLDKEKLMYYSVNDPRKSADTAFSWYITDNRGKNLGKYKNYHQRVNSSLGIGASPLYIYDNIAHFMEFGCDTLLYLEKEKTAAYAIFNMGSLKIDPDPLIPRENRREAITKLQNKIWPVKMIEDKGNIYITFGHGFTTTLSNCIFNKKSRNTTFLSDNGFANDIDGGLSFWPRYIYQDNTLVDAVDSYKLLNKIKEIKENLKGQGKIPVHLVQLSDQITENSNPVLITLKR